MSIREAEIAKYLTSWLDRYAVPIHLRDKPETTQAEAECLARILCQFAPETDYVPFLKNLFDEVDLQMKTRAWPAVGEVGAVRSNLRKSARVARPQADDADMRPVAMNARKMKCGDDVNQ